GAKLEREPGVLMASTGVLDFEAAFVVMEIPGNIVDGITEKSRLDGAAADFQTNVGVFRNVGAMIDFGREAQAAPWAESFPAPGQLERLQGLAQRVIHGEVGARGA